MRTLLAGGVCYPIYLCLHLPQFKYIYYCFIFWCQFLRQQEFTLNIYNQNECVDIRPPIFTHRKRGKGLGAKLVEGKQPISRFLYVDFMRGVDVADQKIQTHIAEHKPRNYFWRRVFVHKLYQAMVNAHVLFMAWCNIRLAEAR